MESAIKCKEPMALNLGSTNYTISPPWYKRSGVDGNLSFLYKKVLCFSFAWMSVMGFDVAKTFVFQGFI